ncbi:MAG: ABC transporter permease [Sulfolobales archaeon]|nr:ABC transporter permease [Sulfolobales archaeon]MDW8082752.1 ABC transporter permease [Sulfolobales archaeon]
MMSLRLQNMREKLSEFWSVYRRDKAAVVGLAIFLAILAVAIFADYIAPHNPYQRVGLPYQRPSLKHPLGTNDIGQDIFSEVIYGTRASLFIGFLAAISGTLIGTIVGLVSGYRGGKVDEVLMRTTDIWLSIPTLLFAIFLVAVIIRTGGIPMFYSVILAIALTSWPPVARLVRSATLSIKERPYIESAIALGSSATRIMFKHIIPNVAPIILVEVVVRTAIAMLTEASLSFLGLGDPTVKSWGTVLHFAMIKNALILGLWWWFLPPGVMIALTVMSVMMIGRGLELYFNPRLRKY